MTGQDIVDAVRAEVIEPNPAFFTNTNLLAIINKAQKTYVRRVRCLQGFATLDIVQGQTAYTLPSDFLGSEKIFVNTPVSGVPSWLPLRPKSIEKMAQEHPNFLSTDPTLQGIALFYYLREPATINLFPPPQADVTGGLSIFYERVPAVLTSLSTTLDLDDSLQDCIEAYVLWKMWKQDQDKQEASDQYNRYIKGIGEGLMWKKKRVLDGKWQIDIESFLDQNYSSINTGAFNNQLNPLNL